MNLRRHLFGSVQSFRLTDAPHADPMQRRQSPSRRIAPRDVCDPKLLRLAMSSSTTAR